ncbi:MAG: hypothetical protein GWN18_16595 [Thermoplasmata archaeon]|nr:fibronectin type III domain-containing protein [Thermoplasmata archaeon]NIS13697.1 fibronectin type III domain-containing protein [Thermoplasmata archaeon]NIS21568.1 fibronectin type III domain-containing protein [Thermoplasmata archaeon]NIT79138.1 fibronectin type III domain-containing protein [Thermoplasmata archaeon]NIU50607.1 fibronectin type III domain-containing protein [Thermoplasmata archaeon]
MKRPVLLSILLAAALLLTVTIHEDGTDAQVPPTVSGVHVLNVGEDYFEIEWETDTPTTCIVEYGRTKDYGRTKELGGSFDSYHKTNITGLDKTTKYHFRIVAENVAGELGYSGDFTVTTGPQSEVEGGTPGWVWGLVALSMIVLFFYLVFIRPARQMQ